MSFFHMGYLWFLIIEIGNFYINIYKIDWPYSRMTNNSCDDDVFLKVK